MTPEGLVLATSSWPFISLGPSNVFPLPQSLLELHKRRKALTEPEARYYLRQIVLGCQYLHRNQVIHRDLKLGNLFLNEDLEVKIGEMLDLRVPGANTRDGREGNRGRMGAREMEGGWEMEVLPSRKPSSSEMESEWLTGRCLAFRCIVFLLLVLFCVLQYSGFENNGVLGCLPQTLPYLIVLSLVHLSRFPV